MYKFGSLKQSDWQMMYDLAKMFLYCFNHWKLETPSVHSRSSPNDDHRVYKENYTRYVYSACTYTGVHVRWVWVMYIHLRRIEA